MLGLRWEDGEFRGIDQLWKDHLLSMDHLKEGIGLRGYGQRDPLTEYKKEAFDMFQEMVDHLKEIVLEQLFKVRMVREEAAPIRVAAAPPPRWHERHGGPADIAPARPAAGAEPRLPSGTKVGTQRPVPVRLRQEVQEVPRAQRRLRPPPRRHLVALPTRPPHAWGFFLGRRRRPCGNSE